MAKVSIAFAKSARADIEALRAWYAEQGVADVGKRLVREIVASVERLADYPALGRVVPEFEQP